MNRRAFTTMLATAAAILLSPAAPSHAEPKVGSPAPAFSAVNSDGKTVNLADYRGKTIVLEWTNDGCPYVRKHYGTGNMQALQKKWTDQGIVWLSVISSPPGEQGFADGARANALTAERKASPSAVLLDPKQQVARAYGATVTPHMYIIKPDGTLAYAGGIDDKATARPADVKDAKNFVDAALAELKAGKPVSTPATRAYGCTVKYAS
jgi:peroxiredoxin